MGIQVLPTHEEFVNSYNIISWSIRIWGELPSNQLKNTGENVLILWFRRCMFPLFYSQCQWTYSQEMVLHVHELLHFAHQVKSRMLTESWKTRILHVEISMGTTVNVNNNMWMKYFLKNQCNNRKCHSSISEKVFL